MGVPGGKGRSFFSFLFFFISLGDFLKKGEKREKARTKRNIIFFVITIIFFYTYKQSACRTQYLPQESNVL